jgi:hypothetical protein
MQLGLTTAAHSISLCPTIVQQDGCGISETSAVRTLQFKGHKIKLTSMMSWVGSMKLI